MNMPVWRFIHYQSRVHRRDSKSLTKDVTLKKYIGDSLFDHNLCIHHARLKSNRQREDQVCNVSGIYQGPIQEHSAALIEASLIIRQDLKDDERMWASSLQKNGIATGIFQSQSRI